MICDACADMADWQDGRADPVQAIAAVGHKTFCAGLGRCDCQHKPAVRPSRYEQLAAFRERRLLDERPPLRKTVGGRE